MNWQILTTAEQLDEILKESEIRPQLIYKHSTRCSISSVVKNRLERSETPSGIDFHYLDLIKYRAVSNKIADDLSIVHESPQVLLINKRKCIYSQTHSAITMDDIAAESIRA